MPIPLAIPLAISGISALAGFFGNKSQTQTQQQSSSSQGGTDILGHTSPRLYDADTEQFLNTIKNKYRGLLENPFGAAAPGINQINRNSDIRNRAVSSMLASRGLSGSPISGALPGMLESSRISDINAHQGNVYNDILKSAGGFFSQIPTGNEFYTQNQSYNNSSGTGSSTTPDNSAAGGLGNLGSVLAYLLGQGSFGKP